MSPPGAIARPVPSGASLWSRVAELIGAIAIAVALAAWLGHRQPMPPKVPFHTRRLDKLVARPPDYALIGNSMLDSRVSEHALSRALGGARISKTWGGGAASAAWYLYFKNYVVASGTRPKKVVFFFRERMLTRPLYRTGGAFRELLQRASLESEPTLDSVLGQAAPGLVGWVAHSWRRNVPAHRLQQGLDPVAEQAWSRSAALMGFVPELNARETVNGVFAVDRLRADLIVESSTDEQAPVPFTDAVDHSFLPPILALGKQAHLSLHFVEVQRRPPANRNPPAPLVRYRQQLEAYLRAHGAGYSNMNAHPEIPLAWFGEGDHLAKAYRRRYSALLVKRMPEIFEAAVHRTSASR